MDVKTKLMPVWEKIRQHKEAIIISTAVALLIMVIVSLIVAPFLNQGARLIGMNPAGEITPKTNLTFSFSTDLVETKDVGVTRSGNLIRFDPAIPGKYRWISQRELRFLPETPFRPSTKYKAELGSNLIKIKGKFLSGKRTVEFSTYRFKVDDLSTNYTYLTGQKKGIQMQARINFNYPVSAVELQKFLKLRFEGWGTDIKYNLNTGENSINFTLTSEPFLLAEKEQKINLSIPEGFHCVDGTLGLEKGFNQTVVTGVKKDVTIVESIPQKSSNECWISIRCSEPVAAGSIANFIQLKPEVAFKTEVDGEYILIRSDKFRSGDSYNLRLSTGLPALNGYPLKREFATGILFEDLEPSLKFNSQGRYLSSKGLLNLGLETVNIDRVNIQISQIYANNIVSYLNNISDYSGYVYNVPNYGRVVKSTVIPIGSRKNETGTTPINLGEFFTDKFRGIFQVVAYDNDNRWRQDAKYVIVTDLGIVAKMGYDELMIWVNSLETLDPKTKVKVSLISRNNQIVATEFTDNNGIARFKQIKQDTQGFESFIILAELDKDFSFVNLENSMISTVDFDVKGRTHLEDGYEAFLYMDRDVFRPGDKGNLVGLIRGPNAVLPPEFPVKLEIRQPDGQIFKELQSNSSDRGACEFAINIPDYAQTGKYKAHLLVADQIIGTTSFSVEEFMPERIKVTTTMNQEQYGAGETASIKVEGINLFGPPATGRRTELRVKLEPEAFKPPSFQSYVFGDPERKFSILDEELGEKKLDENGVVEYNYSFPKQLTPPAKLKAIFQSTVVEEGGRAVSNYKAVAFHPYNCYIGMKPLAEKYGEVGKPFEIKYVVVNTDGKQISKSGLGVEVYRITWNTVYRKDSEGRFSYTSEEESEKVYSGTLEATAKENSFEYTPKDYGRFQIVLHDPKSEARASFGFYASGWGYAPWAMESPEKIELDLEQKIYRVGDNAKLQIKAPFSGKALVTMERGKVFDYKIVNLKKNTAVVMIPVKEGYQPNVYVSVHLIRSIKSLEKKAPVRAFGTVPLMVDCSNHKLQVNLNVPSEIRPNREVEVEVKVNKAGSQSYLTLAAVDEGICQLTNYITPSPSDFFYGKRSLGIDSYDLYSMILPEVASVQSKISPGGDADETEGVRKQNLNPVSVRRVTPVSLWSGLVKLENGTAKIKFKVPQFNGTIRFMAVVSSETNFGSTQKKIIVRDPIVLSPTFPRFVAPQDQFAVPVSVFNGTGKAGDFVLTLKAEGPVEFLNENSTTISLNHQEEKAVTFNLKAKNAIGKLAFKLMVKGNKEVCGVNEELSVRPSAPLTHELESGVITAEKPLSLNLKNKWLPGTVDYTLTLAPFPALKFSGGLQYLLSYPYGCIEQTASKIFPLLYFDNLAKATQSEFFKGGNADYYITQGIERLESMQLRDGGFAYWPGQRYSNEWSSVYAGHCLVEARKAGYNVTDRVYDRLLDFLTKTARANEKEEYRVQIKVYALYVLALAGRPQQSTMAFLKDYSLQKLSNYSRAQLAAAYYYAGDRNTAKELLPESFAISTEKRQTGGNFNSATRADAIMLGVLADIEPNHPAIPKLVDRLAKEAEIGYWGTTQENAFALMAIGKVLKKTAPSNYTGEVFVGNIKIAGFSNKKELQIRNRRLGEGPITVKISGEGNCYYFMKASGILDQTDVKEYDRGITVRREFLDRQGSAVNLSRIRQGDLLIAMISITTPQDNLNNIVVVDMLPAGLEIENPRLGDNSNLTWLSASSITPDYMDIRDDRLILFVSLPEWGRYRFYYAVRAVNCGDYILPSIKAECMYEPEISSFSSGGQISVRLEP